MLIFEQTPVRENFRKGKSSRSSQAEVEAAAAAGLSGVDSFGYVRCVGEKLNSFECEEERLLH